MAAINADANRTADQVAAVARTLVEHVQEPVDAAWSLTPVELLVFGVFVNAWQIMATVKPRGRGAARIIWRLIAHKGHADSDFLERLATIFRTTLKQLPASWSKRRAAMLTAVNEVILTFNGSHQYLLHTYRGPPRKYLGIPFQSRDTYYVLYPHVPNITDEVANNPYLRAVKDYKHWAGFDATVQPVSNSQTAVEDTEDPESPALAAPTNTGTAPAPPVDLWDADEHCPTLAEKVIGGAVRSLARPCVFNRRDTLR